MDLVLEYVRTEIVELGKHFGKTYDNVTLYIDPERLSRKWHHVKTIIYNVRGQPPISNKIAFLNAVAATALAGADFNEEKES